MLSKHVCTYLSSVHYCEYLLSIKSDVVSRIQILCSHLIVCEVSQCGAGFLVPNRKICIQY